jgi:streptomycin 6-kinase
MWEVSEAFTLRMATDPSQALWVAALPQLAADLADRWHLRRDGTAWSGYTSTVWPVRTAAGDQCVLKIGWLDSGSRAEPIALRAWAGLPAVVLLAHDQPSGAMLLERLDGERTLQTLPDVDEACTVIARILASLTSVTAPPEVPRLEVEGRRIAASITAHQVSNPGILPEAVVDQALATLGDLVQEMGRRTHRVLVHGDCHFLNVLHSLPGQAPGWVAIDPLPSAGIREWDVTALLRNRWEDAVATGNSDAALRRRVDLVSEIAMMDRSQVRAIAQAVAVDNLLWLLPRDQQHMFVPPYRVMSCWRG